MAERYNLKYLPLVGKLPGKSMVEQTETAINELASVVYDNVGHVGNLAEEVKTANTNASNALDKATEALETSGRVYIKQIAAVDVNDYYDSELYYIDNDGSTNIPVRDRGFLEVKTNDDKTACEQVFIADSTGTPYYRHGRITEQTLGEETTYVVTWSSWDQGATAEYVQGELTNYLPLSGGTLTGVVNGVTPPNGDNSKKLATTAFVNATAKSAIGYYNSVAEMRKSETAIVGRPCVTLGYYEPNDGGGAVYIIRQKKESDTDVENGSIVVLDNGNVAELLIEGTVNVKQLGAKGDGATDDTPAIQHAINAYNQVAIPPGEYIFTKLTLKSNLKLIGMGGTLKLKDNVCTDTTKNYQIIWSDNSNENVTLDGLIVNGNADNNSNYRVADVITMCGTHCSIRNCTILNAPDSGIMFSEAINSTCEGNYIKGFRDCGIYVNNNDKADQKLGSIVSKNIIVAVSQSGTTGIALKRICQQIQVVNNTIRNCQYGITHEQASTDGDFSTDTVVSSNVIIDNSDMSIILRGSTNCVCSNNYIYSTSATAILVESCRNCTISNNAIVQTYGDITSSISIIKIGTKEGFSPSDSITVVGNTIKINYVASTSMIYAFRVIGTSNTDPVKRISIIGNTVAYTYTSTKSDNAMLFRLSYVTSSIVTANMISGASKIGDIDQNTDSIVVNNQGDNYNTSINGSMLITRMMNGRAIYLLAASGAPSFAASTSDIALEKYPASAGCIGYVYNGAAWKKFGAIFGE